MSTKELRPVCSVGMFDLLKGVAILSVIVSHTYSWIFSAEQHPTIMSISASLGSFLVYGFIIAAGFGVRKRPVKKCALQLKKMFLVPYVVTGLATTLLFSFNYYFLSSSFSATLREGLRTFLSFAIGAFPTSYYWGYEIRDIGTLWFVVALAGGWFILNLILKYSQGWKRNLLVLLSSLIGYFGNNYTFTHGIAIPFCFFHMFSYVLGLYVGYLAKENNWFEKKLSPIAITLICVSLAAFAWNYKVPYIISGVSPYTVSGALVAACPLGAFTPFAAAAVGFGITYLMTHINRRENPITNFLETIGNNSIYILCVHTVEATGMHWYWFRNTLSNASNTHMVVMIFIYRLVLITLGMLVIKSFQAWGGFARLKETLFRKKTA